MEVTQYFSIFDYLYLEMCADDASTYHISNQSSTYRRLIGQIDHKIMHLNKMVLFSHTDISVPIEIQVGITLFTLTGLGTDGGLKPSRALRGNTNNIFSVVDRFWYMS